MRGRKLRQEHRDWWLSLSYLTLFLASALGTSSTLHAQAIDATQAQPAYTFPETDGLDFFKRDIRADGFSTEYSEELMGRASRNGIVVGVFGGSEDVYRRIERTVGEAHLKGIPVAMAITVDNDGDGTFARLLVMHAGQPFFSAPVNSHTTNLEQALAEMLIETECARQNLLQYQGKPVVTNNVSSQCEQSQS